MASNEDWIEARKVRGLLALDWAGGNRSLYNELRQRYRIHPETGETALSSQLATAEEARLLELYPINVRRSCAANRDDFSDHFCRLSDFASE